MEGKLWNEETGPSKAAHSHDAWDLEWIEKRFVGLLECSMPVCKELVAVGGSSSIDYYQIGENEYVDDTYYRVESLHPAPIPISCPEETPAPVEESIREASSLFWQSPESTANKIRQAVENLMNVHGIDSKDGKGNHVNLHVRIEQFSITDALNGEVLLATKWLGNSGSHVGGISREEVLDAFDMIELVLENLYGKTKDEIMAKVAAVNAAKGAKKKP
ncbi:DUF4145 domain-containing protein [Sphingopyxis sp. BSNA05]|uniref:DUF4145 domain-containing protein n=1 Tax=Sphingopyxis sp. BSNA05 TaxID=1236614 RepID=UPI001567C1F7|nr:DUF4145 domain-containing protein [Sphingopyxis sp. BSNA05]